MSLETPAPELTASDLQILFEDNHCIAVFKPARVLTASDKTKDPTLLAAVRAYNAKSLQPGKKGYLVPLHFLDRPVSGVILFAKSSKAAARLSEQFRKGIMDKLYFALVESKDPPASGLIEDYLLKDRDSNVVERVKAGTPKAKKSSLEFKSIKPRNGLAWLEVSPITGRSHQIRVQLSGKKMPIFGDQKYGSSSSWNNMIALHSAELTFIHPISKIATKVTAPVPQCWHDLWEAR